MLALAELDTYHILERFARRPDDRFLQVCLNVLWVRARTKIYWDVAGKMKYPEEFDILQRLRMGVLEKPKKTQQQEQAKAPDVTKMSQEELKDYYIKACASVGVSVDPTIFEGGQKDKNK